MAYCQCLAPSVWFRSPVQVLFVGIKTFPIDFHWTSFSPTPTLWSEFLIYWFTGRLSEYACSSWTWKWNESDVTYSQVWWPILGMRDMHLPIEVHTHTVGNHLCCGAWGAVGAPRRSIEGGESAVHSLPPLTSLPDQDSNSQPFNYESDSLPLGHDHRREGWDQQSTLAFKATCTKKRLAENRADFDRVKVFFTLPLRNFYQSML